MPAFDLRAQARPVTPFVLELHSDLDCNGSVECRPREEIQLDQDLAKSFSASLLCPKCAFEIVVSQRALL